MTAGALGRLRWAPWAILLLAVGVSLVGVSPPTAWARLFFGALLGTGIVAAAGLLGHRARLLAAGSLLLLVAVQQLVPRPVVEPPSSQWTRPLAGPEQLVRHEIAIPAGTPEWDRAWSRASGAAVYVCARSPLAAADGLELLVGATSLGTLTEEQATGPRPGPTYVGFYRLPVERATLEAGETAVFTLRRRPGSTPRPVPICGTFSYRPSAGPDSSRYFDGTAWWHPGPAQGGRFTVELRLEGATGGPLLVLY